MLSRRGKEAIVEILERAAFFSEACLVGQLVHLPTATTLGPSTIVRIDKPAMIRVLHDEPAFAELFTSYLLARNIRIQEDLVEQLFNSAEKRLAQVLLLLAHFGKEGKPEPVIPKISQETLAEMIATTPSRVRFFMTKFKKLGFIHNNGGLHFHSSLLMSSSTTRHASEGLGGFEPSERDVVCQTKFSNLCNFDQPGIDLRGTLWHLLGLLEGVRAAPVKSKVLPP